MEELSNYYQIYIQGHLDQNWSDWLQPFHIQHKENKITILTGPIVDQAALRGLLDRLFDLGICILSFRRLGFHPEGKIIFPL
jgi:hypothetical protein